MWRQNSHERGDRLSASYKEQTYRLTKANEFLKREVRELEVEVAELICMLKEAGVEVVARR